MLQHGVDPGLNGLPEFVPGQHLPLAWVPHILAVVESRHGDVLDTPHAAIQSLPDGTGDEVGIELVVTSGGVEGVGGVLVGRRAQHLGERVRNGLQSRELQAIKHTDHGKTPS